MVKLGFYQPGKNIGKLDQIKKANISQKNNLPDVQTKLKFKEILQKEINNDKDVKFSAHAQSRLISRNILLNEKDIEKLSEAILKAEKKGSKESLILMQDLAFVVNVPKRTVITVANRESIKEKVFTNIDSTIIL